MDINARMSHEEREMLIGRIALAKRLQSEAVRAFGRGAGREATNAFSDSYVRNAPSERDRFSDEN